METNVMIETREKTRSALSIYSIVPGKVMELPMFTSKVAAGFPSPADDYVDLKLDLNKYLVNHPSATFYVKVKGSSMINAGIKDGDMLIVDRSIEPKNNDIAVCVIDGEFTVKRISKVNGDVYLFPENPEFKPIRVTENNNFQVWGVVLYIINKAR